MNLYILVEGRRTERKVYPAWLKHLLPELSPVDQAWKVVRNNYYLFSGNGYPSLFDNHLRNSIEEVNELGVFNYLLLFLDVDDTSVGFRKKEVNDFISKNNISLINSELKVIPQNRCIETWFLGHRSIFKSNPQNQSLSKYVQFYNVKVNDPELMGKFHAFNTISQFHAEYCTCFLQERNIKYTKNIPRGVIEYSYLKELMNRHEETGHLDSFGDFIDLCNDIKREI